MMLDRMVAVQDPVDDREYRGVPDIARFFRLAAGGLNKEDLEEMKDWAERRRG